jgi:glutaconate CoA-transferase, subunit A
MARFLNLGDAVRELVEEGDMIAFEGFTHLIPVAAVHETIRQRKKNLSVVRMTPDIIYDQMIGMGMIKKAIFRTSFGRTC